ncbi:MAG: hypothetical protein JRJ29_06780, partial [Deltaproteobacteria bacterium]|nr:hypothetical protein [Deltaproteobacteria bacterium]
MIAKMKKVTLATLHSEVNETLEAVRDIGILHVTHVTEPRSSDMERIEGEVNLLEGAVNVLSGSGQGEERGEPGPLQEPVDLARHLVSLARQKEECLEEREAIEREIERIRPLGEFDPSDLEVMRENALVVKFYRVLKDEISSSFFQGVEALHVVVSSKGRESIVMVIGNKDFDLPYEEVRVSRGLRDLELDLLSTAERIREIQSEIDSAGAHISVLEEALESKREELEFAEVAAGAGQYGPLSYLQGFCPVDL